MSVESTPSNIPSATNQPNTQRTNNIDEALSCDHRYKSSTSNSSYCESSQSKNSLKSLADCNYAAVSKNLDTTNCLPAEIQQHFEIQTKKPSKCHLSLDLASNNIPTATKKQLFNRPEPLTCPSPVGSHNNNHNNNPPPINK